MFNASSTRRNDNEMKSSMKINNANKLIQKFTHFFHRALILVKCRMKMKLKGKKFIETRIGKTLDCSTFQRQLRVRWDITTNNNENEK